MSLARTRRYSTQFVHVSVHHIQPAFFFGFDVVGAIKMATPEKALVDVLYLTPAKTRLFKSLPELEFPETFSWKKVNAIVAKIKSSRRRALVRQRLKELKK